MLSYEQIDELKIIGQISNADYMLLILLKDYNPSNNSYVQTADLALADMDSNKIEQGLRELQSRGLISFQASSLKIVWSDFNEESRFNLNQIQDQLQSGIFEEKQAFYYELLIQKPIGSEQIIDVYDWSGVSEYSPPEITRITYDWSRSTTKFSAQSDDWLIEWRVEFPGFDSSLSSVVA